MKKNVFRKIVTLLLAMVLLVSLVPVSALAAESLGNHSVSNKKLSIIGGTSQKDDSNDTGSGNDWENNILSKSGLDAFKKDKSRILSVTFLDSLYDAPSTTWHLGKGGSKYVQGWVEYEGKNIHIYIAADGGMSAELCCEGFFEGCDNLVEVNFNGAFHTDNVESMKNMFNGCEKLELVDIETLDTSKVENMYQMFRDCSNLEELDMSNFDTANVKNMSCMFSSCASLQELDLSSFDTAKVTNMSYMFSGCKNLEYVNTSSFNTSKVTNMSYMFRWCTNLSRLDLGGWDFSRVRKYSNFLNPGTTVDGRAWEKLFD